MTVEIAIMNLSAVALAADSAVTAGDSQKIFSSDNKLFALSDVAPVGVLVYGDASFMSIPWETLIKEYRRRRAGQTLDRLSDYADDFLDFLAVDVLEYVSREHQVEYAESLAYRIFEEIEDTIHQEASDRKADEFDDLVDPLTPEIVNAYHQRTRGIPLVDGAPADFEQTVSKELGAQLRQARERVFNRRLPRSVTRKLSHIALKAITGMFDDITRELSSGYTGIVIAGFGNQDMFPAIVEFHVEGVVLDVLKARRGRESASGPDDRATIVPFAQADMINLFMQGIDPGYHGYMEESVVAHLDSYTDLILGNLDRYSADEKKEIEERLRNVHPDIAESLVKRVDEIGNTFAQSIMGVVAMLPKDQLAEMAEALVSLTSLKRRVSPEEETVGGPTDVALITKGDGLVWIKRKHYFPAELNPAYFARTYNRRRGSDGTDT